MAAPSLSKTPTSPRNGEITSKPYLLGFGLALALTALPFGLVATHALRPTLVFVVIGATAIAQVVVHLRYFLRLDLKPSSQNKLIALCFAAVVLVILVGGALWIMIASMTA